MPDLGSPLVRELRRLSEAYRAWPGPVDASPSDVLRNARVRAADGQRATTDDRTRGASRRDLLMGAGAAALGALAWRGRPTPAATRPVAGASDLSVAVVGAGLAGLTCTYRLRQAGIPAVLYEAQHRVGGRCWTAHDFFRNGQVAEHGGQFIDTRHRHIRALVAELGLSLVDSDKQWFARGEPGFRWIDGALRTHDELWAGFGAFQRRIDADYRRAGSYRWDKAGRIARHVDDMSVLEYLDEVLPGGHRSLLGRGIGLTIQSEFGVEPGTASAVNLFEQFAAPYPGADERYHVAGGNDRIVQRLERRLPAGAIERGAPLTQVWRRPDGRYGLRFAGRAGVVVADRVVLALPFTTLRDVDTEGLPLPQRRRRAIDHLAMGSNAKLQFQLDRPLAQVGWNGNFISDGPEYVVWDSTYGQAPAHPRTPVLTIYTGGREGASYATRVAHGRARGPIVRRWLGYLERGVPDLREAYNGRAYLDSWVDDPWVHGSYAGFSRGQYTSYWGYLARNEGHVYFAGEHTSTFAQGYLEGGVESGERAARQVVRSVTG